jgi:SAM-dependent methyltransferase
MGELLKIATNPEHYDSDQVDWSKEGEGLQSPNRRHYWSYMQPYVQEWDGKDLLDIGAGTGWLCDAALREGNVNTAIGVEPASKSIALAHTLYPQIEMIDSSFEEYQPDRKFDIAVAVMTLLHMHPLEDALQKVADLLKVNGQFYAVVPDFEYFRSTRKGRTPQIEELVPGESVTAVEREYGTVADIVRETYRYQEAARATGLVLEEVIPMPPSPEQFDKYPELKDTTVTHFLRFRKP